MNNQIPNNKQEVIDKILENLPVNSDIQVELPSKGKIYSGNSAVVTLRPMSFEDEKIIASQKGKGDPISLVLSRCTSNLPVSELIAADKLFLLVKLREISYGDDYSCKLICQNCQTENNAIIKLSELPVEYADENFSDPVTVYLSGIKKNAKVKIIRNKDEVYLKDTSTAMNHLWRFVEEIDGQTDKSIISAVIEKLPSKDVKKIINSMQTKIGVNTKIDFDCASCQKGNTVEMPITADFFEES